MFYLIHAYLLIVIYKLLVNVNIDESCNIMSNDKGYITVYTIAEAHFYS